MDNLKKITLNFDLEQVANDVLVKCGKISDTIKDEADADIRARVMSPDSPENRSIVNRSVTEAFGDVKKLCQKYLKVGRDTDSNMLERLVKEVVYKKDQQGHDTDEVDHLVYEEVKLELWIENFNLSVTDALKSSIHRYVVDYVMGQFLQDQVADKAGEYAALAEEKDKPKITSCLNARDRFNVRKPAWI